MYQKHGSTHIFRMSWIARNLIALAWVIFMSTILCVGFFGMVFQAQGFRTQGTEEKIILPITFGLFILLVIHLVWTRIIPVAKKAIVLQVDPDGVSSHYLHGTTIGWSDLLDVKVAVRDYVGRIGSFSIYARAGFTPVRMPHGVLRFPKNLKITLVLRDNSPSWLAIPRKWIFWHSGSFDILLNALPPEEQVQAALTLRAAFARYGGEVAGRLMRGIRQEQMAEAFEELGRWVDLPENLRHPDFTLPPRDAPNAKP